MNISSNIIQDEFIGLETKVVASSNPAIGGINGRIVDETRNTFVLLQNYAKKVIIKDVSIFNFYMPDESVVEINGKVILGKPEDRIKKRIRRRW